MSVTTDTANRIASALKTPFDRGKTMGEVVSRDPSTVVDNSVFASRPAERLAERTGSATLARAGQRVDVVGAVLSLIIVAVIAYVGLDVVAEVDDSTDVSGNTALSNASDDLDSGVESAFGLMGVVFLVILLSVIIGLFLGLRR